MTISRSECRTCGEEWSDGRAYCNARCEAAYRELVDEYLTAARLDRHPFEVPKPVTTPVDTGFLDRLLPDRPPDGEPQ